MGFSIKAFFGGDTTALRGELGALEGTVKDSFGRMARHSEGGLADNVKGIHHAMRELHQFLMAGGIVEAVKGFYESAVAAANKATDAADENAKAVLRLEKDVEGMGLSWGTVTKNVTGFFVQAGEGWGTFINQLRGVSFEQQEAFTKMAESAQENLERIAAARHKILEQDKPENMIVLEKQLADLREKNAQNEFIGQEKILKIKSDIADLEARIIKLTDPNSASVRVNLEIKAEEDKARLIEAELHNRTLIKTQIEQETALLIEQAKLKGASDDSYETKIVTLGREHLIIQNEINKLREAGIPTLKAETELTKNNVEQEKLRNEHIKARSLQGAQEIDFLEIQAKVQGRLSEGEQARAEVTAQNAMREFTSLQNISDEEKKRLITDQLTLKIKQQQQEIDDLILKTHGNLTKEQSHQLLLLQAQIDAYEAQKKVVESFIPLEIQITEELAKQKKIAEGRAQAEAMNQAEFNKSLGETLGTPRGTKEFGSASDATLQEIIQRDKDMVWQIGQTFNQNAAQVASGNFSARTDQAKYQLDAAAAQKELDLRSSVRGVDYSTALKQYKGDPLNFDAFYQMVNSGNQTNTKLDQITSLLKNTFGG